MTSTDLYKIRRIADYQFGIGIGDILFPSDVKIEKSRKTGKIRRIYHQGKLLATMRASDGYLALSIDGARRIVEKTSKPTLRVVVKNEVAGFIKKGRNVFAKHVVEADPNIRPGSEVIVVDENDNLLAVGRATLNSEEMLSFKSGEAVKVRKGVGGE
ncbi:MAG: pseudouridine synthase [Candidatus Methanomethylicota archaeon]|uniref:Pseudouridine synthase n=1 Tax=Thermoproteota archaeon TaxID=2056631 RepID=A0A497EYH9_9CREN|nr:MAG: pseudouridine synthase [Candidatus Verstraetearchaeota archaeon]